MTEVTKLSPEELETLAKIPFDEPVLISWHRGEQQFAMKVVMPRLLATLTDLQKEVRVLEQMIRETSETLRGALALSIQLDPYDLERLTNPAILVAAARDARNTLNGALFESVYKARVRESLS